MTTSTQHKYHQGQGQRPHLQALSPLARPYPGCSHRSLLSVLEELTTAVQTLTAALVGEEPEALVWGPVLSSTQPSQEPLAPGGLTPEQEAQLIADLTDPWDAPWHDLSVVELRSLLRDLPIDRSALPRPIEVMRRHELLDALHTLPAQWGQGPR